MKANEILTTLDLMRNKEAFLFTSSLAQIYSFLNSIKGDISEAKITERDLIISGEGKIISYDYINKQYGNKLVNKSQYENKEVKDLSGEVNKLSCDLSSMYDKLKILNRPSSKTKPERLEYFKIEMDKIREEKAGKEKEISYLLESERSRLYTISHSIEEIKKEFKIFTCVKINVATNENKGHYSFILPIDNNFYNEVCHLLKLPVTEAVKEDKKALRVISIDAGILKAIKKASKFTSDDELRPVMQGICLHFENNTCEVVATDAHKLYMSEPLKCNSGNDIFEIIIDESSIKKVCSIKAESTEINITVFEESVSIAGEEILTLSDARYPQYKNVVPTYTHSIVFDRKNIIKAVKQVVVYANKSTSQVNFYMNGQIEISAQDIDFSFEAGRKVRYISKSFEDTTMGFNGKFFNNCLDNFKEDNIEMLTDGHATKAVIFTNKKERVLLMPLMINP